MSRFKYSGDELEMNKVLKMNQDTSQDILSDKDISLTRSDADSNIEASLALLRSLGKQTDIEKLSEDISAKGTDRRLENPLSWNLGKKSLLKQIFTNRMKLFLRI